MKRASRILKIILIVVAVVLLVVLLLKWRPLDEFLTSKFGRTEFSEKKSDTLIRIDGYDELLPESERPYVYSVDDRLYVYYDGGSVDITPPGVSAVFYSEQSGLSEKLKYRDHACFDAESGQLLFVVDVQNVPQLYLADLKAEPKTAAPADPDGSEAAAPLSRSTVVADNVDSFLFIDGMPVFAEGYTKYNNLCVRRDGKRIVIAQNVTSVPVAEQHGILYVTDAGSLEFYSVDGGEPYTLADGVSEVIRYRAAGDKLTAYCKYSKNYLKAELELSTGKAERAVIDKVPDLCVSGGARSYEFGAKDGKFVSVDSEGNTAELFDGAGHIYNVFEAEVNDADGHETLTVLFASKKGLYRGTYDGENASCTLLCAFSGKLKQYKKHPWLITEFMAAGSDGGDGCYLLALSPQSRIVNKKNPYSWLNRYSSYVFGLYHVNGGKAVSMNVPLNRKLTLPRPLENGNMLYETRYADNTIRALSVLNAAKVLSRDLLKTEGNAAGATGILAEAANGQLFIRVENRPAKAEPYTYYCVANEGFTGVRTLDREVAVSFGETYESTGERDE
ncbi:MAG: hypothetical protein J5584_02210 [Clostridia bacterium]|nr:hypothetical protein [Clostridia bacterium]